MSLTLKWSQKKQKEEKGSVQPPTPTPMNKKRHETIEMVESRLNKWMKKNEHNGSFSITEADGVKFFHNLRADSPKNQKHTV